jgi:hypothetical protein
MVMICDEPEAYDPSKLPKRPGESVLMFTIGQEALTGDYEVVWTGTCYKITKSSQGAGGR